VEGWIDLRLLEPFTIHDFADQAACYSQSRFRLKSSKTPFKIICLERQVAIQLYQIVPLLPPDQPKTGVKGLHDSLPGTAQTSIVAV
jgi:hypothetical protein